MKSMLGKVRKKRPLVLHVTNTVTMNDCANITICAGGSPIMCDSPEEIDELASNCDALVLNIGTVNAESLSLMLSAGRTANDNGVPVVLDPVGVGATEFRIFAVKKIIDTVEISVIKGNGSEISFLAGKKASSKGVDSLVETDASLTKKLALSIGCIVCMTGETDYVSDGKKTVGLKNGVKMMDSVSGTGCMLSSVVGCFVGACKPDMDSVIAAVSAFNVSGESAAKKCNGPGSLKTGLLDELYNMRDITVEKETKFE